VTCDILENVGTYTLFINTTRVPIKIVTLTLNLFNIISVFVVHNSHSYVNCNNVVYIYHVYDIDNYYYWGPITVMST